MPLVASWLSVRSAMQLVPRPVATERMVVWVAGAIALSMLVYQLARRVLRGFSSLGLLYSLSLTFPDSAPSRLRSALRARRVEDLQDHLSTDTTGGFEPKMKAKRMTDLMIMVSRREFITRGHSDRVRAYSESIGTELGLSEADMHRLRWAALLHDVGKLDVPKRILDKREPGDEYERAMIDQHPVDAIPYLEPFADWLGPWGLAATDHHERWDGTGYPSGLAGKEISLAGRIIAVANSYDAMTSTRSYRKPMSPSAARQELVDDAGGQFDPQVVRAFLNSGISDNRAGLGPIGALIELPSQLGFLLPGVTAGAGVAAATAVAVAATTVAPTTISSDIELAPPTVERVVEEQLESTTSTTTTTTTTARPSTTRAPAPTTTTTTTTTEAPTTTRAPAPTTTTAAPTTTPAPPTTTTTTTIPPSTYPTVPTTTAGTYPTTGS